MPIVVLAERSIASAIAVDAMTRADDFIWLLEETIDFIGGQVPVSRKGSRNMAEVGASEPV